MVRRYDMRRAGGVYFMERATQSERQASGIDSGGIGYGAMLMYLGVQLVRCEPITNSACQQAGQRLLACAIRDGYTSNQQALTCGL
jgi:hypothetical protein